MTPVKGWVWLANRLATWGSAWWWWRQAPQRGRRLWGLILINVISFGLLMGAFLWMHQREILR